MMNDVNKQRLNELVVVCHDHGAINLLLNKARKEGESAYVTDALQDSVNRLKDRRDTLLSELYNG